MTLIVAIPASDGIVFASDSQVTVGHVRATAETKIFELNDQGLWGASGELAVIQRFAEWLEAFPNRQQLLSAIRDDLASAIKLSVESLLKLDFRTQFASQDPSQLLQLHPCDFLFAEYRDRARVLHILANGVPEWVEGRFTATGSGDLFAHALMAKYSGRALSLDRAKLLAHKVIEEAIQVGAYGLGAPVDIWTLSASGRERCSDEERAALEDAAQVLREGEIELLVGAEAEKTPEVSLVPEQSESTGNAPAETSAVDG